MARERHADLVLSNARVLTMEPEKPRAEYVALKGGRILGAGDKEQASHFKGPRTRDIDCQGMTLVPGFNDAHCHLMALASSLRGVDCGPDKAGSIAQVVKRIGERAEGVPPGKWIRAFEYDEFYLAERRHPTRWDLDRATPLHPVRLDHRTGHASVLNSRALDLLGISRHTPDPMDGVIERETGGEPTGLLFEMGDYIRRGAGTGTDQDAFLEGIKEANGLLLSVGVTSIQDASPGNDFHRWQTFRSLKETGHLVPRVTVMAGASHLQSFRDAGLGPGLTPGSGDEALRLGAVKVMLGLTTGALHPSQAELMEIVTLACESGYQLAFHAVEEEAVEAAANALIEAQKEAQRILPFSNASHRANARHRIEHCSECPPHLVDKLKIAHALVVTQPSFIYHNGEKYLSLVEDSLLPHLYPVGPLVAAAIPVAAGSDAPVTRPDPLLGIYSAVTRRTRGGPALFPANAVSVEDALRMHSVNGAYASFEEKEKGSIATGKLADLVLLDLDPTMVEPERIRELKVMMTMVGGEVAWQR